MKTIIYCFTGTGNSLQVANELSENLGDCRVKRIYAHTRPQTDADAVGFVFPVHLWGMPRVRLTSSQWMRPALCAPEATMTMRPPDGIISSKDSVKAKCPK